MATIEFDYEGKKVNVECSMDEEINNVIKRFESTLDKKEEELYYMYGGGFINKKLSFNNQANLIDKQRKIMSIIVNKIILDDLGECLKKSEYLICPKCQEKVRISVKDYKIELYDCKNNHRISNISINDFEQTQIIDEAKIKCQICNMANKNNSYNKIFFICMNCKKNICQICSQKHDKTHSIINYDDKFFTCDIHYEQNISYCEECKKDICMSCEMKHKDHKIITYGSIMTEVEKMKEEANNFISKKDSIKNEIKDIINKLNNLINTLDNYFGIYQDTINSQGKKKRNYFLLKNIQDMLDFNNNIIQDLNQIINDIIISNKIDKMMDIYNKMNLSNKQNDFYEAEKIKRIDTLDIEEFLNKFKIEEKNSDKQNIKKKNIKKK